MPPNSNSNFVSSALHSTNNNNNESRQLKNRRNMAAITEVWVPGNKISNGKKRELEKDHVSSASNTSNNNTSSAASKLSKIGKRLRESCRNLRGKQSRATPEDFKCIQLANESNRSKHYVAMDFTGKEGKILSDLNAKGVQGLTTKDGYTYFRRKVSPKEIEPLLTELQSSVHLYQPWFHKGVGRDLAQRILTTHAVDGAFLVRDSSVSGGFVISYSYNGRICHAQVLPDTILNAIGGGDSHKCGSARVFYSLDEGKTKFFDLLQMVEFYQLNKGTLNTHLSHCIVRCRFENEAEVNFIEQQGLGSNGSSNSSMDSQILNTFEAKAVSAATTTTPPFNLPSASYDQPVNDLDLGKYRNSIDSGNMDTKCGNNVSRDLDATTMTILSVTADTASINGDDAMLSEAD